jgi:molybdate transport system ATP-binding protein
MLLRPEEVVLSSAPAAHLSLQNQLPGRVASLTPTGDRVLVAVDIGQPLLAEVSPRAAARLALAPGVAVHVLFKAVALAGPATPAPSRS